jgi:integrase
MSVALRRQRDGKLRPYWYGEYRESNGKRVVINLGKWKGTPPPALLGTGDQTTGDRDFEASREKAEAELKSHADQARRKGRVEHLTERLIESKTGRAVKYVRIDELLQRWRNLGRETETTERHLVNCDAHFRRFIVFIQERNPSAAYLYEVTAEDAAAFVSHLRSELAPATAQYGVRLMNKALSRFLPVGSENPFQNFIGKRSNGESGVIHRKPFTPEQLQKILDVARRDAFMYPLIVAAACTGMRRGDVCKLRWSAVDLDDGMLAVRTSKTKGNVEIPIFPPLREVLERRGGKGRGYVFPEAASMLDDNPTGLTRSFKKIVATAIDGKVPEESPVLVPASEIELEGLAAVHDLLPEGKRRQRVCEHFRRYCEGESVRQIEKATGIPRVTVSADLHLVEEVIGKQYLRRGAGRHSKDSMVAAVNRTTRVPREHGMKAASIRDWHALRTTFVTLALSAGVPVEIVQRVTGHKTVAVVMEHYFRPDRQQFKSVLAGALPLVLTGGKTVKASSAEELTVLVGKLSSGTATDEDKKRLRLLAAKV